MPADLRHSPVAAVVAALVGLAFVPACFDPEPPTMASGTDSSADSTGGACEAGATQACTCDDGQDSTQTCLDDGSGFGACECDGADTTATDPTTDPTEQPTTDDPSTSGPPPRCADDDECADMARGECEVGVCDGGMCVVQPVDAGEPCGDAAADGCTAADTCDGKGQCATNDAPEGFDCDGCELGVCACSAGACGDCDDFAAFNHFTTPRSIAGWTLTGGWGLYREAPQNFASGPTVFDSQVFGTDGNRVAPYPGNETETSTARTRPTILPATLDFLSWHVDEGTIDTKQVRVSVDGGATFVNVADCAFDATPVFCQASADTRPADAWDAISLPVPPDMVGQVGVVEFFYNTQDQCCSFERGWFIDAANFATECDCAEDATCAGFGGTCGASVCGVTGECELDAVAAGTDCGDATENQCNTADACDGLGYCATNNATNGLTQCEDCGAGFGNCNACQEGTCADCDALAAINDFSNSSFIEGWVIEDLAGTGADWQLFASAPQSQAPGSTPTPLAFSLSFGTDGNRQAPYPGAETEHSRVTTPPDVVPAQITFASWNVDEGTGVDNKTIEISVDGGVSWTVLVDCNGVGIPQPFCVSRNDPRAGNDWDAVAIDTAAFEGQVGQLRFTYNTGDGCCSFERGWFIDNMNFGEICFDSPFG